MTVLIETTSEDSKTIVSVAGRLQGLGVGELLKTHDSIEGEFVLDLSGLRSADPDGIKAIRKLLRAGAKLRGASPFIQILLGNQASADEDAGSLT